MKNNYLLPPFFKKIGWFLLVPFGILALMALFDFYFPYLQCKQFAIAVNLVNETEYFKIVDVNILTTITLIGFIVSLLFVSFSREKIEDEYISKIREKSLVWAVITNYIILGLAVLFLFEFAFLTFVFINMYSILILFIAKFNWALHLFKNSVTDEE